jgi:adenosylhomocysteinase
MPGLARLADRFARQQPLASLAVLLNMHLSEETASLGEALARGGARLAYLNSGREAPTPRTVRRLAGHGGQVLPTLEALDEPAPILVVEGNGRVFTALHGEPPAAGALGRIVGISVHTSGGGRLVDAFEAGGGQARIPVAAVYRTPLKATLETGLGTSQTAASALLRGLGAPVAGRRVAVVGYGHVGRGVARTLRTLGARIVVVETRAEAELEAVLAGFAVAPLEQAVADSEIAITATGRSGLVAAPLLETARDGLVLANLGNRPDEIDTAGCARDGEAGGGPAAWRTPGGRRFRVLGGGTQLNHAIGRGNPPELMDLSLSLHGLVLEWLATTQPAPGVLNPPAALVEAAARLCLGRAG